VVQLGLVGPLFQVTRTIGNEVQRQASARLREHFSQPVLTEPIPARVDVKEEEDDLLERRRPQPM
jgi:hypothetical protein